MCENVENELQEFYNLKTKTILGSDQFIAHILGKTSEEQKISCQTDINRFKKIYPIESIINIITKYFNVEINRLQNSQRGNRNIPRILAIFYVKQYCQLTHQAIAKYFTKIKPKSIGNLIGRLETQIINDLSLQKHMDNINCLFSPIED